MAEPRGRAGLRIAIGWLLTALIAVFAFVDWGGEDGDRITATAGDGDGDAELRIVMISDAEVSPGDAVVVRFEHADDRLPIGARIGGAAAEIIERRARSAVVRVPPDAPNGRAALRLVQGARKSKAWDLLVRPPRHRKLWTRVLGGLALFFYGFGVLSAGLRGLAGRRLRDQLGRLTEAPLRSTGLGIAIGATTQLTTTATALTVGLIEARLLALAPALAIAVGAQLGASLVGALLPLGFARESLEILAVGVVWSSLADSRRVRAIGHAVLGVGLVLYGLRLLQTGIEPLFTDPKLLAYVGYLQSDGVLRFVIAAAVGVVLGLVLQGPGPVYGLGLGLAQVSGALSLENLLAILAGANLGAAIGAAIIAGSSRRTRALVRPQLAFGAVAMVAGLALVPIMSALADAIVPGAPGTLDYRKSVMVPHLSAHLALAFAATQLVITGAWTFAIAPTVARWLAARPTPRHAAAAIGQTLPELATNFARYRGAIDACVAMVNAGEHNRGTIERGLADARTTGEELFATLAQAESSPQVDRLRRAVLGALQLQRAVEHLAQVSELGVERGLALTASEQARLTKLHQLTDASLAALAAAADGSAAVDIEAARGREIEMNVLEAESRTAGPSTSGRRRNESTSVRLGVAELIDAFEHVGNHLFRVAKAMTDDDDELD